VKTAAPITYSPGVTSHQHIQSTVPEPAAPTGPRVARVASPAPAGPRPKAELPSASAPPAAALSRACGIASSRAMLLEALKGAHHVRRTSIGSLLADAGVLTHGDVVDALEEQRKCPETRLGDLLVAAGTVQEDDLYRALGEQMGVPYVHLGDFDVDPEATALLPLDFARAHRVLPLMLHEGRLVVATDDPSDSDALSALRFRAQRPIEAVLASRSDLDTAIAAHYPVFDDIKLHEEAERLSRHSADELAAATPEHMAAERPIVRLVNNLLLNAVQRRASDVHLRPRDDRAEARYRIDGSLLLVGEFSAALVPAIVARIKVMASLDVAERRLPQDGAIHMETPHGQVDMRVSIMPAVFGENVVIRILDRSIGLRRLSDIGFQGRDGERMRALIGRNQGLFLVTGPTGSGKSTTLYAALQELNTGEYHIVTVEDPVEYRIDGLVQIQAQPNLEWGFGQALRHILRHDPDIILIGEIRDAETAKVAIESALTGHLVFSTLHTNSAAQTVTRLIEIGIAPYLVNATLAGVLAQRLARRNCQRCKAAEKISPELRAALGVGPEEQFWRGTGCEDCSGTGYRGRIAAYELLQMSPAIRRLLVEHACHERIEEQAVAEGMTRLTSQAVTLARAGTIALDEVLRVRLD
jgi:type IV pilus assembly protein PilB